MALTASLNGARNRQESRAITDWASAGGTVHLAFQNGPQFHSSRVQMHRETAVWERTNRSSSSTPADKTHRINLHKLHPHLTGRGEIPVEIGVSLGLGFQGVTSAGPGQKGEEDLSKRVKARTFKDILMSLSESNQVVALLVDSQSIRRSG